MLGGVSEMSHVMRGGLSGCCHVVAVEDAAVDAGDTTWRSYAVCTRGCFEAGCFVGGSLVLVFRNGCHLLSHNAGRLKSAKLAPISTRLAWFDLT